MSDLRFSEGPWRAQIDMHDEEGTLVTISTVAIDADDDGRPRDYGHSILEGNLVCEDDAENQANGALIAAAPELYTSLQMLVNLVKDTAIFFASPREKRRAEHCLDIGLATLETARGEDGSRRGMER